MSIFEIKNGIYSVGVLNPNLRIFDIVMKTEYGTSYNAYLVKGEKTALIETVHTKFFDQYIENIKKIVNPKSIDYVVLNHTEPDHSGSLKTLLEENPNLKVVVSNAGNRYCKAIVNRELNSIVVKDNDTIDLGGKTLRFYSAPFLHWPDSMFTYVEEDKVLFSCDFLGCHYCEPTMYDTTITYEELYKKSLKYYFDVIFGPFKQHVLKGLDRIKDLDLKIVCPSHGPILTDSINEVSSLYRDWSMDKDDSNKKPNALILYVSAYGCTKRMALELKKALEENNIEVEVLNIIYNDINEIKEKIENSDALMFGSPTINRDALKPVWDVLSVVDVFKNQGKHCGIFGSYGWSGEAVKMLIERAKGLRLKVFKDGIKVNFVPSEDELKQIYEYGQGFAELVNS